MNGIGLHIASRTPENRSPRSGRVRGRRIEMLIAPMRALGQGSRVAARRALMSTLPRTDEFIEARCETNVLMCAVAGAEHQESEDGDLEIVEGWWPEPVGMRVACAPIVRAKEDGACGVEVEMDRLGLRPIFHGRLRGCEIIVSTQPALLAAMLGADVSAECFAQALLVGYPLDDCSAFEGVHRLRPGQSIRFDGDGPVKIVAAPNSPADHDAARDALIERTIDGVAAAFERDDALELSGGMDSRLVLAMGLSRGVKPRLAFTIGEPGDEDVEFARALCRQADIEHHRLPAAADKESLVPNGLRFVEQSGFTVDASAYAWLPSVFHRLSAWREGQIGGGGGECAVGFYDSPLDPLGRLPGVGIEAWIRRRLLQTGMRLSDRFEQDAAHDLQTAVVDRAARWFEDHAGEPWRERTARFYREQRMPNAGGGVLSASACWYRPCQPLLSTAFQQWCGRLSLAERRHRLAQRALLERLAPELATIPLEGGRTVPCGAKATVRRLRHVARAQAGKTWRRAFGRRKQPDVGAARTADDLSRRPDVEALINELAESGALPIRHGAWHAASIARTWDERSFGMLITFALARRRATELRRLLGRNERDEQARKRAA